MQFWQPCQKVSEEKAKKFSLFSKTVRKKFPQKQFSSKSSFGHAESSFVNHAAIVSDKLRKIFADCPKKIKKGFSQKHISPQNVPLDTWNAVLTTMPEKFYQNTENFILYLQKCLTNESPSKKAIILEMFHWMRKMRLWKTRRRFYRPKVENYSPKIRKGKKMYNLLKVFHNLNVPPDT